MKKSILIFCTVLATISLMSFVYVNWSHSATEPEEISSDKIVVSFHDILNPIKDLTDFDLLYKVSNRWSSMTKEELMKVSTISEILGDHEEFTTKGYRNVRICVLHNDKDVRDVQRFEIGQSEVFNPAQLELLQSIDYSTNLRISALTKRKNKKTGTVRIDSLLQYMTIIPEKEAKFMGGQEALIQYLKESSKEKTANIRQDKVQPGKVFFTVTKKGTITNVKVVDTSGYPTVDEELVKILTNMPEKWEAAENAKGEKVDQEFVFFFGSEGC